MSPSRPIQQTQSMFKGDPHCELTRLAHCVCSSDWDSILRLLVSDLCYRGRVPDHVMLPATRGNVSANVKLSLLAWRGYDLRLTWCSWWQDRHGRLIGERCFQCGGLADVP
jgi:hypothetical protein